MDSSLTELRFWPIIKRLYAHKWVALVTVVWGIFGGLTTAVGQIDDPGLQDWWKVHTGLQKGPLYWWLVIGLAGLAVLTVYGAVQEVRRRTQLFLGELERLNADPHARYLDQMQQRVIRLGKYTIEVSDVIGIWGQHFQMPTNSHDFACNACHDIALKDFAVFQAFTDGYNIITDDQRKEWRKLIWSEIRQMELDGYLEPYRYPEAHRTEFTNYLLTARGRELVSSAHRRVIRLHLLADDGWPLPMRRP